MADPSPTASNMDTSSSAPKRKRSASPRMSYNDRIIAEMLRRKQRELDRYFKSPPSISLSTPATPPAEIQGPQSYPLAAAERSAQEGSPTSFWDAEGVWTTVRVAHEEKEEEQQASEPAFYSCRTNLEKRDSQDAYNAATNSPPPPTEEAGEATALPPTSGGRILSQPVSQPQRSEASAIATQVNTAHCQTPNGSSNRIHGDPTVVSPTSPLCNEITAGLPAASFTATPGRAPAQLPPQPREVKAEPVPVCSIQCSRKNGHHNCKARRDSTNASAASTSSSKSTSPAPPSPTTSSHGTTSTEERPGAHQQRHNAATSNDDVPPPENFGANHRHSTPTISPHHSDFEEVTPKPPQAESRPLKRLIHSSNLPHRPSLHELRSWPGTPPTPVPGRKLYVGLHKFSSPKAHSAALAHAAKMREPARRVVEYVLLALRQPDPEGREGCAVTELARRLAIVTAVERGGVLAGYSALARSFACMYFAGACLGIDVVFDAASTSLEVPLRHHGLGAAAALKVLFENRNQLSVRGIVEMHRGGSVEWDLRHVEGMQWEWVKFLLGAAEKKGRGERRERKSGAAMRARERAERDAGSGIPVEVRGLRGMVG